MSNDSFHNDIQKKVDELSESSSNQFAIFKGFKHRQLTENRGIWEFIDNLEKRIDALELKHKELQYKGEMK